MPTLADTARIEAEWKDFVDGLDPGSMLRDVIEQSWLRSREHGVDPRNGELHRIDDAELRRRQEQHRALLEIARPHLDWLSVVLRGVAHALYVADADGIILCSKSNSRELRERYGLEPGYDWSEATMGTNGAGTALAAQQPVAVVGPEHYCKNLHRGICTGAPIHDVDGEVIAAIDISVGMIEGTPERLALAVRSAEMIESQLARQASRERLHVTRRVLADVSHEVRTPMTVIQTYVDILRNTSEEPAQLHAVEVISRNSAIMLDLLDDLLDLSRVEAGHAGIEKRRFRLAEVLNDVELMLEQRARDAGVQFDLEIEDDVPDQIESDPTRLRQILVNLTINAVKFTDEGGSVIVRVRTADPDASRLVFEVVDTGVGLSVEQIEHIFEPFHTNAVFNTDKASDADVAVPAKGTGLGLTISRELANALGGDIEVESSPGKGSIFRFEIGNG